MYVEHGKDKNELFDVFVQAGLQAGYPYTADMNGFQQEGFGPMDMTIHKGQRWSASNAYLHPVLGVRKNLRVRSNTLVHRVLVEKGRAVGVLYEGRNDKKLVELRARKEVILSSGAVNTPHLLILSGIGDAKQLQALNIPVVAHMPGVGQNLQDHLDLYIQWGCRKPVTLYTATWRHPHNMLWYGIQWFLRGKGRASSSHLESGGFIRSDAGVKHPDIQYHFLPGALTGQLTPGTAHAYQAHCSPMRPTSRGHLSFPSANPRDAPHIQPNYLATQQDRDDIRKGVRLTQEIMQQPAFDPYRGKPMSPTRVDLSDAELDAWIRAHSESAYHPCCTAKMGSASDPMAVVDETGAVRQIERLRVVDASIMPSMISGNLNATVMMMAEKLSDVIRGRPPLLPSPASHFIHSDWQTKQR